MSAFIVEDHVINSVVAHISNHRDMDWSRRQILINHQIDLRNKLEGPETLGKAMFALNVKAVEARYGEGEASSFGPLDYKFEIDQSLPGAEWRGTSTIQAYKNLRCWLYQCTEREIDKDPLYLTMEKVSDSMAHAMVQSLREYDQAAWNG